MQKPFIRQKSLEKILEESDVIKFEYSAYRNIEQISRGGFSTVNSADYNGKKVALKSFNDDKVNKNFLNKLKILHAINLHPNIIQFHGITCELNPDLDATCVLDATDLDAISVIDATDLDATSVLDATDLDATSVLDETDLDATSVLDATDLDAICILDATESNISHPTKWFEKIKDNISEILENLNLKSKKETIQFIEAPTLDTTESNISCDSTWFEITKDSIAEYGFSVFENKKVIGKGGFGVVYSAEYNGEKFALKSLDNDDVNKEVSKEFIKGDK
ncbi:28196_t:CDS:2 [Racocetra persica]|uniref:28196_t:CDS:1 n=1 Tax=Racocetra persica TaxID=160502 RepID=A0ACA9KJ06_9GLOM|nr:28196_t:CDS:2 [Racocetra persica]